LFVVKIMKKILLCGITVILILITGCTTASPGTSVPVTTTTPSVIPSDALPMNGTLKLGNDTHSITVSIDSFEIDTQSEPGKHTVTIYVAANNTGIDPIKYVWFSKLTDINGNSYGGIRESHGGSGARTAWIPVNFSEAARDYVEVNSDSALANLTKGAVLDVYFMEQQVNVTPSVVPDYHVAWVIDPGTIG
jgi:hypothetical protein